MNIGLRNVNTVEFPTVQDQRGKLSFCQGNMLPFTPKRIFWVYATPSGAVRGNHAHKESWQLHICFNGQAKITLDDGKKEQRVILDHPNMGLIIGPLVWHSFTLEEGALLQVITSNLYDEKDYVRDYSEFQRLVQKL